MKEFLDYMNQVKAEKELKKNTVNYVEANINNINLQSSINKSNEKIVKEKFRMKKFLAAASTAAVCMFFVIIGNFYYQTPVEYLSVDINPSVELGINAFNKVVSVSGINNDGKSLLKEKKLLKLSSEDAVEALVKEAGKEGFIAEDGSTVIAVTAVSDNEEKSVQLKERAYNRIQQEIEAGEVNAIAYGDYTNSELRKEAQKFNISPGKYKLISVLKTMDSNINIEQYRNSKITDIISKANDLLKLKEKETIKIKEINRVASMIKEAAQKINKIEAGKSKAGMNQTQNQTQNQNQTGTQTGTQTQTQNQTKAQTGNQNQIQTGTQSQEQTQTQSGTQTQTQNQTQTGSQSEAQTGTQSQDQIQTETETQTQQQNQIKAGGGQN